MAKTGRPEKYTLEFCLKEIRQISDVLFADGKGEGLKYFTWHDLIVNKPYPRQCISEWREKFKDNKDFSDTIKKIDAELENRLYKLALLNKVNTAMAIFSLKNNYGWKDKQETEHSGIPQNITVTVDTSETAETLKKLRSGSKIN